KMAAVTSKVTYVRSLHHTIPSHAPATVFMTSANKPTPALQYPSFGSLAAKLPPAAKGVPPYVTFQELRNGTAGGAGYLGTGYHPFVVEGGGGRGRNFSLRVRGIDLPPGFSLEELNKRDKLLRRFDETFNKVDPADDLV